MPGTGFDKWIFLKLQNINSFFFQGVHVTPAFQLDVTEIIFKTKTRFLQSSGREPVVV